MKIGILTHHYVNNFGAFLQAYALQKATQELYPNDEVVIINCVNIKHFVINTGGWFRFYKDRETLKAWLQKIKLPLTFYKARHEFLKMSKTCFTTKQVNKLGLDYIIVGSDEVWNYKETKGNAKIKFGHGLTVPHLLAYAPSVGKTEPTEVAPDYVTEGMKKFEAISARDDLTAEFVHAVTGKEATRVLDPTFLAPFPKAKSCGHKKPYILFYYCEHLPEKYMKEIVYFAHENGYAIYGAGECNKLYDEITVNLTPFEWVQMFRDAEYVFTGTFHGAVFSILNRKQLLCYLTNESRIRKVGALLKELQISDRIISNQDSIKGMIANEIDYDKAYEIIDRKREESKNYIKNHITR